MSLSLAIVFVLVGFVLLVWSADVLVDNASELARQLGVSTLLVGIIVVGFGTSAPELFVSASAALQNKGNLALGNALGSNITNIGLVLGMAALIRALPVSSSTAKIDLPVVIVTALISIGLLLDGHLSRIDGIVLLVLLVAYLAWSASNSSGDAEELGAASVSEHHPEVMRSGLDHPNGKSTLSSSLFTLGSIVLLMIGAEMLVRGAVTIATAMGVSELIIGLTIIAIGTSLPELAAAVAAARKGVHDMIIGNIIGSNIFNTLGVLGLMGTIRATDIETNALWRDFPVMLALTVLMFVLAFSKGRISRGAGAIMLASYLGYLTYLIISVL